MAERFEPEYTGEVDNLSEEFVGVRETVLHLDFIPGLDRDLPYCNTVKIPEQVNVLENDIMLMLTTGRGFNWIDEVKTESSGSTVVKTEPKEMVDIKGYFINERGSKGYLYIVLIDGKPYSEAYWLKSNTHTFELKQLVTPEKKVLSGYSLNPDFKKKVVQMPGIDRFIPFKKDSDF